MDMWKKRQLAVWLSFACFALRVHPVGWRPGYGFLLLPEALSSGRAGS